MEDITNNQQKKISIVALMVQKIQRHNTIFVISIEQPYKKLPVSCRGHRKFSACVTKIGFGFEGRKSGSASGLSNLFSRVQNAAFWGGCGDSVFSKENLASFFRASPLKKMKL